LYPLHVFVLLLWVPYIALKGYRYHVQGFTGGDDPFALNDLRSFVTTLFLLNGVGLQDRQSWNFPSWTISVELFTYFVFFALVVTAGRRYRPVHALLTSVVAYVILFVLGKDTLLKSVDFGFFRCAGGFFLGVFVHSLSASARGVSVGPRLGSLLELLVIGAAVEAVILSEGSKVFEMLAFVTFAVVILTFTLSTRGVVSRFLCTRPMLLVGTLSYSIYMVHALIYNVALNVWEYVLKLPVQPNVGGGAGKSIVSAMSPLINVLMILIILAVAYVTYTLIEKPWRDRFRALSERLGEMRVRGRRPT
jgi:peptidoglycan/LPS O-acetylase OafA/YrhL